MSLHSNTGKKFQMQLGLRWDKADLNSYYNHTGNSLAPFLNKILYSDIVALLTLVPATVFYTRIPAMGGLITPPPQRIPSYDARERLKISTCGKNWLVCRDIFFYENAYFVLFT